MAKSVIIKNSSPPVKCYEIEFTDMDHTLEWLLEEARQYGCSEAIPHLEKARKRIIDKKRELFD